MTEATKKEMIEAINKIMLRVNKIQDKVNEMVATINILKQERKND